MNENSAKNSRIAPSRSTDFLSTAIFSVAMDDIDLSEMNKQASPIGTFMKNIKDQWTEVRTPPKAGPNAVPMEAINVVIPIADPLTAGEMYAVTIARFIAMIIPAPRPWTARIKMIVIIQDFV